MAEVIVLGAGMAGIGAALALQEAGHAVSVIDRRAPGCETSHGNAGVIQAEAVEPYAIPRDLPTLIAYARGRSNDVVWHGRDVARMLPALWSYFRHSAPRTHRRIAQAYAPMILRATADHDALIGAAGAGDLIRHTGMAELYRDAMSFDRGCTEMERMMTTYGVTGQALHGADLRAMEPDLKAAPRGAVLWPDSWSCRDPGALVRAYATLFQTRGGRVLIGDAASVGLREAVHGGAAGWQVTTEEGRIDAQHLVVALGPWSGDLLARFGYRIPMVRKRGYHGHYDGTADLRRPLVDMEAGVVIGRMRQGLRITTGAELVDMAGPETLTQLRAGEAAARHWVDLGAQTGPVWHGHRPCMPDMLPMVGRAPRHANLWFDFGHGHQGFTLGPTTGRLLARAMAGERDTVLDALDPAARLVR